jgi:hypothetical protein
MPGAVRSPVPYACANRGTDTVTNSHTHGASYTDSDGVSNARAHGVTFGVAHGLSNASAHHVAHSFSNGSSHFLAKRVADGTSNIVTIGTTNSRTHASPYGVLQPASRLLAPKAVGRSRLVQLGRFVLLQRDSRRLSPGGRRLSQRVPVVLRVHHREVHQWSVSMVRASTVGIPNALSDRSTVCNTHFRADSIPNRQPYPIADGQANASTHRVAHGASDRGAYLGSFSSAVPPARWEQDGVPGRSNLRVGPCRSGGQLPLLRDPQLHRDRVPQPSILRVGQRESAVFATCASTADASADISNSVVRQPQDVS